MSIISHDHKRDTVPLYTVMLFITNLCNMILWLFYIIFVYVFPCKIDTNHNGIYLDNLCPIGGHVVWCVLCLRMVMSSNHIRVRFRAWKEWPKLVEGAVVYSLLCLNSKWWCHFLCSEGNHASGLQSWDHRLWCPQYNN